MSGSRNVMGIWASHSEKRNRMSGPERLILGTLANQDIPKDRMVGLDISSGTHG